MFRKLKVAAYSMIFIGGLLILAKVGETYNLYNAPLVLIIVGVILLVISLLVDNKEKSLLCRVGLHKFKITGQDRELSALSIYECERCGKTQKAMRTV
ncbi:MAG TPA: hypothetical protein VK947_10920 [Planococcus sp. (in: firmicutes)]|nr:hypothetical protein [Planococcus sp. (in: firmicutes)]